MLKATPSKEPQPEDPPLDPKQKRLSIDTKTGHLQVILPKKRKLDLTEYHPIPLKKKDMGTHPSTPYIPPSPPPNPNLIIKPSNSPPPPLSPDPQDEDYGDGDEEHYVPHDQDIPQDTDPWVNYDKDPDQNNDPDLYHTRPSPPDDNIDYVQLINRAAKYHGVELHTEPLEENFWLETLTHSQRSTHTLPMLKGMLKHAVEVFKDPVRERILTPRVDKKYKPAPTDPAYIKGQLPLDSLVLSNVRKRANSQTPDKESKLIDASGKRVASQAANHWHIASAQALLARYDRAHYDELEELMQHLPDEYKTKANDLIQEGKLITNTCTRCGRHSVLCHQH